MIIKARMFHRSIRVLDGIGTEIDVRREKLINQRAKGVGLRQAWNLIAEFKFFENVLDIW